VKNHLELGTENKNLSGCNRDQQIFIYFFVTFGDPDLNLHLPQASWEGGKTPPET